MPSCHICQIELGQGAGSCSACGAPALPELEIAGGEGARVGPFWLGRKLGEGGMGVVYEAAHAETGEPVALKTVKVARQRSVLSIRREIRALARLNHPGIARVVAEGVHDGVPWYAMAYVEGVSMRRWLRRSADIGRASAGTIMDTPAMPASEILASRLMPTTMDLDSGGEGAEVSSRALPPDLLPALALVNLLGEPLSYMHGEGFVHRDLKPENVLVRDDGRPILIDFGLALHGGFVSREQLAGPDVAAGTPQYMAPEQIRGRHVDARADLYALGCMLYEMVTGAAPFAAGNANELAARHLTENAAPPSRSAPSIPPELDALILSLLAKDPGARPGHADAIAVALKRLGVAAGGVWRDAPKARPCLYRAPRRA